MCVGGVEEAESGGYEGWDFTVGKGKKEALAVVVGDICISGGDGGVFGTIELGHQLRGGIPPRESQIGA